MATWAQVSRAALALPLVEESGRSWRVKGSSIAWERPLRRRDLEEVGDQGEVLGVRTATRLFSITSTNGRTSSEYGPV